MINTLGKVFINEYVHLTQGVCFIDKNIL